MRRKVKEAPKIPQDSGVRWAAKGPAHCPPTPNFTSQNSQALMNRVHNTLLYIESC